MDRRRPRHTRQSLDAPSRNRRLSTEIRYVIRLEPGVQSTEETLTRGSNAGEET